MDCAISRLAPQRLEDIRIAMPLSFSHDNYWGREIVEEIKYLFACWTSWGQVSWVKSCYSPVEQTIRAFEYHETESSWTHIKGEHSLLVALSRHNSAILSRATVDCSLWPNERSLCTFIMGAAIPFWFFARSRVVNSDRRFWTSLIMFSRMPAKRSAMGTPKIASYANAVSNAGILWRFSWPDTSCALSKPSKNATSSCVKPEFLRWVRK